MLLSSEAKFAVLAVLGVLATTFVTCLANSVNAVEDTEKNEIKNKETNNKIPKKICETDECKRAAASIRANMDTKVDPCTDFYRFSCSKFIDRTVIPKDESDVNSWRTNDDLIQEQIKASIENDIAENSPRTFKILQTFYNSCTNTKQIETNGVPELRNILKTLGGWPIVEGKLWNEKDFDWQKSGAQFRNKGYSTDYFINFGVIIDLKNNIRHTIRLDQASTILDYDYLINGLNDEVVQAYLKYMLDLAEIVGANREAAKPELIESLKFEIELAKISLSEVDRRDMFKLYNPMTIAQLQATVKGVQWLDYVNNMLAPQAKVGLEDTIIVVVPSFLQKLPGLIAKTPKRVLANYAMWGVVAESAPRLGERVLKAYTEYTAVLTGTSVRQPRWKECVGHVLDQLNIAASALYVRRHFDEASKAEATDQVKNIQKTYERLVAQVDWMDEKTKKAALDKLSNINIFVAHPDEFLDDKKLDGYYQNLNVYPDSFLKNALSVNIFQASYYIEQLRKPVNRTEWSEHADAAVCNSYYLSWDNSIIIAAGMLQGVFFSKERPKYMNYGAIGMFMGHEMTHSIDNLGRLFDKDGNLKEWWQPGTEKKFLEKGDCFVRQYGNYTVKQVGLKINGKQTQDENIADNGGIREAFYAYNEWEKQHGEEAQLPGLPYTSQQMFFISTANMLCVKYRNEALKDQIMTNIHSPEEFRVIGPMSNMPEFAEHFKCPEGSVMNPHDKCTLW